MGDREAQLQAVEALLRRVRARGSKVVTVEAVQAALGRGVHDEDTPQHARREIVYWLRDRAAAHKRQASTYMRGAYDERTTTAQDYKMEAAEWHKCYAEIAEDYATTISDGVDVHERARDRRHPRGL